MGKKSRTAQIAQNPHVKINGKDILAQLWRVAYSNETEVLRSRIPSLVRAGFGSALAYREHRSLTQGLSTEIYATPFISGHQNPPQPAVEPVEPVVPVRSSSLPGLGQRFFNSAPGQRVTYAPTQSLSDVPRPVQEYLKKQNSANQVQLNQQRRHLKAKINHQIRLDDSPIYQSFTPYLEKNLDYFRGFSDQQFLLITDNMRTVLNLIGDLEAVFTAWRPLYDDKIALDQFFRLIQIISARFDDGIVRRDTLLEKARTNTKTNNSVSTKSDLVQDCLKNCVAWKAARNQFLASALPVIELMSFWAAAEQLLEEDPRWRARLHAIGDATRDESAIIQQAEVIGDLALSARQYLPDYLPNHLADPVSSRISGEYSL